MEGHRQHGAIDGTPPTTLEMTAWLLGKTCGCQLEGLGRLSQGQSRGGGLCEEGLFNPCRPAQDA